MKKSFLSVIIFIALVSLSIGAVNDYSDYVVINKYNEAIEIAEFTEKPVMILFSVANCHDCEEFKNKTLMEDDVINFLKERFIILDLNPIIHLKGFFPIGVDVQEEYSYSTLFRKFGIKRTPTSLFLDKNMVYKNRTTGFYEADFFIKTAKSFDMMFEYPSSQFIKIIDADMALKILKTLPNSSIMNFDRFKSEINSLEALDYYIVENTDFHSVKDFILSNNIELKNVFVYEDNLDYMPEEKMEVVVSEEIENINWTNINKAQVKELMIENSGVKDFYILDVRTPEEFASGTIENSINIDFFSEDFPKTLENYDKEAVYLVYCLGGGRSSKAVKIMDEMGFEYIYHYEGGYMDWSDYK
jgi:rhodanese-related sulfurtransferase/thioredoxin-related protein